MSGQILVVESIASNRIMLTSLLESAHYQVTPCAIVSEVPKLIKQRQTDVIVLDLSGDFDAGLDLLRTLSISVSAPPVIATLAFHDTNLRLAALEAGAADVLSKPLSDGIMQARIRSLLRAREVLAELRPKTQEPASAFELAEPAARFSRPSRIVVLSSRPQRLMPSLDSLVKKYPGQYEVHHSTADFDGSNDEPPPDLIIVDGIGADNQPKMAGEVLRLQADLRSRSRLRLSAQLVILPPDAADLAAMALDMGADDLVTTRVARAELGHRINVLLRRKAQNDDLRKDLQLRLEAAVTDPLTGLYNRRFALPWLSNMAEQAAKQGTDFAIMVLDIDHFKSINDTHGHAIGDLVLIEVAKRLKDSLRSGDMIARIGGEEFMVAMPNATLDQARQMAERLRRTVEYKACRATGPGIPPARTRTVDVPVTLSVGVALGGADCRTEDGVTALFGRADAALYQAKSDGRNMVTISTNAA